jgi:hypothetical protein
MRCIDEGVDPLDVLNREGAGNEIRSIRKSRSDFVYGLVVAAMFVVTAVGVGVGVFGGGEQAALQAMQARMDLPVPGRAPAAQIASERTEART